MTWIAPITFYDGDVLTAAQINNMLLDNFMATAPGVATTKSRFVVSAGKNRVRESQWVRSYDPSVVNCSGNWPADPDEDDATEGPSVTFQHGGKFLLLFDARIRRTVGTGTLNYAPVITSGPGQDALPRVFEMAARNGITDVYIRTGSYVFVETDPGVTTATMKYGSTEGITTGEGDYAQRRLSALPL